MFFETDALVIKATKSINNDLFLTLFSLKAGKIEVVANGAKSSKSQLSACSKPFVFGHFVLNTRSKVMRIVSCEIHASNFRIADQLETLAYGNYFLELCGLTTHSNVVEVNHYQLIIEIISILSTKTVDFDLLRATYLIKLSELTGHKPNLSPVCTSCGQLAETFYLSISEGGLSCGDCSKDGFKLNLKWLKIIEYLMNKDVRIISNTKIHPNYTQQLVKIFESFLMFHLNIKEIKSNDFLAAIK